MLDMDPVKPAEIEVAHAPEARADLVEEAAGLAEIFVFRELADLGHREGGEDFPVVKDVHDVGDEGFVAGAAAHPAAGRDVAYEGRGEAADLEAELLHAREDAAGEAPGRGTVARGGRKVGNGEEKGAVSLADDAHDAIVPGGDTGGDAKIDAAYEAKAVVVIRVVPKDLKAPVGIEIAGLRLGERREEEGVSAGDVDHGGSLLFGCKAEEGLGMEGMRGREEEILLHRRAVEDGLARHGDALGVCHPA